MIDFDAFTDEFVKIAEEQEGEGPGGPFITKKRLKRLAVAAGLTAAGTGLGYATGKVINRYLDKKHPKASAKIMRAAPIIGGAAGLLGYIHRHHTDKYIRHGGRT